MDSHQQQDQESPSTAPARKRRKTVSRTTDGGPRDYVGIADAFAAQAIADVDGLRNGKWIRLAASRYLKDRKRAQSKRKPFIFDEWAACDPCDFIEKLPHIEGTWLTPTIVLHPAHVFFVVNVFGFRQHDGARRFSSALLSCARKNAKSTLAAAILLYCLCCEDEAGMEVISAATTGKQARIVFDIAKRMVGQTADLREHYSLEPFSNSIAAWQSGGSFKPINSKASTQDGLNPSHVELDEIHAHKTHDLLNVLQSATGARRNPLWLYTTTEGYETPGPWPELRHFSQQVLQNVLKADHYFALIFALDDRVGEPGQRGYRPADDDFDESKWIKANPLIEVNDVLLDKIQKAAIDAKQMPGRHAEFKIKRLNRRASGARTWINLDRWIQCNGEVNLDWLKNYPCWGGLDLASTTDLCSFRLVWRVDGEYYTWGRRWVPEWATSQRTERGTVPYAGWIAAGYITQTPGDVTDYAIVERDVVELAMRFKPKEIAYDRWNATDLVTRLLAAKLPMVEFRQGAKSYNPAMQELERAYIAGKLHHGNDPVLTWCASNLVPRFDENMSMAPDRKRSADKIDDICALLMAIGRSTADRPKAYEMIFV